CHRHECGNAQSTEDRRGREDVVVGGGRPLPWDQDEVPRRELTGRREGAPDDVDERDQAHQCETGEDDPVEHGEDAFTSRTGAPGALDPARGGLPVGGGLDDLVSQRGRGRSGGGGDGHQRLRPGRGRRANSPADTKNRKAIGNRRSWLPTRQTIPAARNHQPAVRRSGRFLASAIPAAQSSSMITRETPNPAARVRPSSWAAATGRSPAPTRRAGITASSKVAASIELITRVYPPIVMRDRTIPAIARTSSGVRRMRPCVKSRAPPARDRRSVITLIAPPRRMRRRRTPRA